MSNYFIIICIYRSLVGNFTFLLNQLELILNKVHKISNGIILCGDFNINYFNDNNRKDLLDSLIVSFNPYSTINFLTRVLNSCTLIDNIYINTNLHTFSVFLRKVRSSLQEPYGTTNHATASSTTTYIRKRNNKSNGIVRSSVNGSNKYDVGLL
jgi:hypothetical protein